MDTIDRNARRAAYPGLSGPTYLDTPSCGLLSRPNVERAHRRTTELMERGVPAFLHWQFEELEKLKVLVADTVGGTAEGVFLVPGFSNGLALLAPILRGRDKVLLVRGDYHTLAPPFAANGGTLVWMDPEENGDIPLERIAAALERERPGIFAVSHVQWNTGYTLQLAAVAALCRQYGALFLVDATQSWCVEPIDVAAMGIDILGSSGYKWPLAGFGNGFLHLAPEVLEECRMIHPKPAQLLMPGHTDPIAFLRLKDALEDVTALGVGRIAERVRMLTDHAVQQLEGIGIPVLGGRDAGHRAGILIIAGDESRVRYLEGKGIRCMPRGKGVRIGPHWYNTQADIDKLVEVLRTAPGAAAR